MNAVRKSKTAFLEDNVEIMNGTKGGMCVCVIKTKAD